MTFELGSRPNDLKVYLTDEGDFNSTIHNDDGPWAGTASIELRFGQDPENLTATWAATLAGDDAVFSIDKALVDTVLETNDKAVSLFYVDSALGADLCWATGFVVLSAGAPGVSFSPVVGFPVSVVVPVPGPPGGGGGGGGAVDSVNGHIGVVVLDTTDLADFEDAVTALAGRVMVVDNGDGTVTVTVTGGGFTLVDNGDGTADLTLDGETVTIGGGSGGGAVDSVNTQIGVVVLDADDIDDTSTTHKFATAAEKTKLAGIATGATANSSDATLLARANHTGTQSADTLTDGTTNKAFLATERTKLTGVATGATANDTDANLKNRANHTGTQVASTVSDFSTAADARITAANKKTDSMTTNRLLGRGTGGTGAIEEITLGTNLSLTGTTLNAAGGSYAPSNPEPSMQNLIGWAYDPVTLGGAVNPANGTVVGARIPIAAAANITNIILGINTFGSGLTAGQNFAALYQGGTLLGVTADQSTNWTNTYLNTMAIVSGPIAVSAGFVDVAWWTNGTTRPQFCYNGGIASGTFANAGASGSTLRGFSAGGGYTTTAPSTLTKTTGILYWAAVS